MRRRLACKNSNSLNQTSEFAIFLRTALICLFACIWYPHPWSNAILTIKALCFCDVIGKRIAIEKYAAPKITATQFINEMLLNGLSHSERLREVSSTKFRGQYLTLLSETLKISKRTIYLWGTDIELPKMPKYHQHTLAYAFAAYRKKQQQSIAA